ncbi:MAG TPA: hypothetical protein PK079_18585 [Leptospiraceae bacterium]|nr:hypothetical protein [Leptospiraceae bacterium]HMW07792.1 hypothetical protein [Leptospiraceae bacterium]HMX35397.1 hypothetical protein [Leptospiraceae bacterium]HMY34164.1 hypothetical protein [Leptospiraceae bacterium]HMZ64065.1 hypothetical protein [Leptospiraceae bacterium]
MDKKTIFLLPLDLKGIKQTRITPKFIREIYDPDKANKLPEHIEKKKKNIFTAELNRLIGKISEKNKAEKLQELETKIDPNPTLEEMEEAVALIENEEKEKEEVEVLPQEMETLPKSESLDLLNQIYLGQNAKENALKYLEAMFQTLGIKAYCVFFYEPHSYTYFPVFSNGLTEKAQTNLLFYANDRYIQNRTEGYTHLFFQPVLVNDIFFKKKLSPIEFNQFSSIILKFLDKQNLNGLIALFVDKYKAISEEEIDTLCNSIDKNIEPLVPFLNSYFESEKKERLDSFDFMRQVIHGIQIQSKNLGDEFYFTKLKITNFLSVEDAVNKKKQLIHLLKKHLLEKEGIIDFSHNEILLLTKENEGGKIIQYISENAQTDFQFEIFPLRYPDNGKNLYLYF